MGRVQLRQDLYLLLDILNLVFCAFEVNNLDGDGLLGPLVVPECKDLDVKWGKERQEGNAPLENLSERTLACAVMNRLAQEGVTRSYRSCLALRRTPPGLGFYPGGI